MEATLEYAKEKICIPHESPALHKGMEQALRPIITNTGKKKKEKLIMFLIKSPTHFMQSNHHQSLQPK
jgi:hypothetical protein